MMSPERLEGIFQKLCLAVRHSGVVAKAFQGKVQNEGKEVETFGDESERLKAMKSAKTLIDEAVQEILLTSFVDGAEKDNLMLDAEEETPLAKLFPSAGKEASLIIDPIDGTLEYLEGRGDYSICVGLAERGSMKLAIVFFPARDTTYAIRADGLSYEYKNFSTKGVLDGKEIVLPQSADKAVYKNARVPEAVLSGLRANGYAILDDADNALGAPDAMLTMLSGKSCAYISETRWARDILVGAILGNAKNGFTRDASGNPLVWPEKGRVTRAIFGNLASVEDLGKLIFSGKA